MMFNFSNANFVFLRHPYSLDRLSWCTLLGPAYAINLTTPSNKRVGLH
jgi:hypothetical protein